MLKRVLSAGLLAVFSATTVAFAASPMPMTKSKPMPMASKKPAEAPTPNPKPSGEELAFVTGIQADLTKRFPTAADAEKAGYQRYTMEDNTGAISYANRQWQSVDAQHPSQLWYDVNGNLIGADFSILKSNSPKAPKIWGIDPARWLSFGHPHYHYIIKDPKTGALRYGAYGGKMLKKMHITAPGSIGAAMTASKAAKADVVTYFTFPALWDLQVWVKDNPNGAFAEKNPNVIPSKDAEKDSM
ncbi:MAG: hypothetical protein GIW97_08700 [Candidatus Eremiobacteraeota bacterium]|nr:hypothetical protein [Candidatus Eremiobacteraeota bacterium]